MASSECQRCHRVFERMGLESVCPNCAPLDELEFRKIKDYLMDHQGASSTEVIRETGASLSAIKRYLKEDRLEIVGDIKGFLRCEQCGAAINSGRLCQSCYKEDASKKVIGMKANINKPSDSTQVNKLKYNEKKK